VLAAPELLWHGGSTVTAVYAGGSGGGGVSGRGIERRGCWGRPGSALGDDTGMIRRRRIRLFKALGKCHQCRIINTLLLTIPN
jgi:hypothetical protein